MPNLKNPPLYQKIAERITSMIEQGSYRPGERLPSIRELSRQLGAAINTVAQAYSFLENTQLVDIHPQSGHYVRRRVPLATKCVKKSETKVVSAAEYSDWKDSQIQVMRRIADERLVPFGLSVTNGELFPSKRLGQMLSEQGRRHPLTCATYSSVNGALRLRTEIAKRSLEYGCAFSPDRLVVTSGCIEAVNLALQAVCRPGDTVVIESPLYCIFLKSLQWMGLKIIEIPTTLEEGMSLDVLRYTLKHQKVHACLVISNFSNPSGSIMPSLKKQAMVRLLAEYDVPLIEDDVYGDLGFGKTRPPVFKAYDEKDSVILCSSFTKTLSPGYRVGWIAAGRFQNRVEELKWVLNIAAASPTQLAVAEFLSDGGYDKHLRTVRRALESRMTQMRECILRHFPPGTGVTSPTGGLFLWVELPESIDGYRLYEDALRRKISVAPGMLFALGDDFRNCIRFNFSFWSDQGEKVIEQLGRAARSL